MKLNLLSLGTADRRPKAVSGIIAQESDLAIPQCIYFFIQFLSGFQSGLPDKKKMPAGYNDRCRSIHTKMHDTFIIKFPLKSVRKRDWRGGTKP